MSAWASQPARLSSRGEGVGALSKRAGAALVALLGVALIVRALTDDLASPYSRHSGSLDSSAAIALLFGLLAAGLLLRRREGVLPAALATFWLCVWTAVAVSTHGASAETLREGVREGSVIALGVIVYNMRGGISGSVAARLVQLMGLAPALIAVYQLATHTGMDIAGNVRANGTFAHPDSAAMFFAIAAAASLWLHLDGERRLADALLTVLFMGATIATLSLDGLAALVATFGALGVLRPGPLGAKLVPCLLAGFAVLAFLATPIGARRIASQSSTRLATAEHGEASTSLGWRLHKWKTLLPDWERSPLLGRGLGTTTTGVGAPGDRFASKPPHNEYVRYLVETGLIGAMILLAAAIVLLRRLLARRRTRGPIGGARNAPTIAVAVLIGCLVNALADNTFLNSPTCYAVALIVVGALSAPSGVARRRAAPHAG
jgi:O-antigen ligase